MNPDFKGVKDVLISINGSQFEKLEQFPIEKIKFKRTFKEWLKSKFKRKLKMKIKGSFSITPESSKKLKIWLDEQIIQEQMIQRHYELLNLELFELEC